MNTACNAERPDWTRRDWLLIGALWIPFAVLTWHFSFLCDDAFITFRYARHWAAGDGLRFNLGTDPPVEGYSNFLWVVAMGVVEWLGQSPLLWSRLISFACGSTLLVLFYRFLRRSVAESQMAATFGVLFLATMPPFFVWSTGGLETVPYTLLLFVTYERLLNGSPSRFPLTAILAGLGTSLIRVEGFGWALILGVLALWLCRRRGSRCSGPWMYLGAATSGYAVYFLGRYLYFQSLMPNTYYAKTGLSMVLIGFGLKYVGTFFLTFISPLIALCGVASRPAGSCNTHVRGPALLVLFLAAYCVLAGGDFMAMSRFLVPALPFFGILLTHLLGRLPRVRAYKLAALTAVLSVLPAFNVHLAPAAIRRPFQFRSFIGKTEWTEAENLQFMDRNRRRWEQLGRALRLHTRAGESISYGAIGAVGYHTELFIYDRNGLVNREVARQDVRTDPAAPGHVKRVARTFFVKYRPTYVHAALLGASDRRRSLATHVELTFGKDPLAKEMYRPVLIPLSVVEGFDEASILVLFRYTPDPRQARRSWETVFDDLDRLRRGNGGPHGRQAA